MFATARTFLSNFQLPCLYIALAAAAVAGSAGVYAGRRWDAANVSEAEKATLNAQLALSDYKTNIAQTTSTALTVGFARQTAAADAVRDLQTDILNAITAGYATVAKSVDTNTKAFRSATDASEFKCLDSPLPDDALRVYRRAGGAAPSADH